MIREIVKDNFFLSQVAEKATKEEDEKIKRMRKRDDLLARSRCKKTEKGKHNA